MHIPQWFSRLGLSGRHPQRYHVAALVLALIAMSVVATASLAQETISGTNTTTGTSSPTACAYSYSDWGACQSNNQRSRAVTGTSPAGCVQVNAPVLQEACNYTAPTSTTTTNTAAAISCSYTYSSWGACQSNNQQSRTVVSVSPTGCSTAGTQPELTRSCTYQSPTTSTAIQCVYSYSTWGACQASGKRVRTLSYKSPAGCAEYVGPVLEQSCVYDTAVGTAVSTSPTETATAQTTTASTNAVTPVFAFSNIPEGMTIRGTIDIRGTVQSALGVEYFLVPTGSNTYKYIGSAARVTDSQWNLHFRSQDFPNGEFYLRAKVRNIYGEYGSGQRRISIANEGQTTVVTPGDEIAALEAKDVERKATLQQMETELQIPKIEASDLESESPDQQKKRIFDYCQSNSTKCFPERDSDKDGLSDVDEIRYGTDPKGADSDLDGFIDGDEVKSGFDPMKYSPGDQSDRIVFEDPKTTGEVKEKVYAVQNVALEKTETGGQKMRLSGKGLPNSFVTIYVYSDPIVLTVKTDSEGNWTYELDKEIEDGEHAAYVAITDNTGKITAKSEPLAFIKTAQAVTVIPAAQAATAETLPVTKNRTQRDLLLLASIIIAAVAIALAVIGLTKHRHDAAKAGMLRL